MSDDGDQRDSSAVSPPPPAFTIPTRSSPVSLSSLLSSESDHHALHDAITVTIDSVPPITLPSSSAMSRPRGALSSLMNSPMDDDPRSPHLRSEEREVAVAPAEALSLAPESPHGTTLDQGGSDGHVVVVVVDALSDLETLQRALQSAVLRMVAIDDGSGGPPAKRQKKGKHGRKPKANATTTGAFR